MLELLPSRRKPSVTGVDGYRGSTRGAARVEALATLGSRLSGEDEDAVVPLVRHKPLTRGRRAKVVTKSFERPSDEELAAARASHSEPAIPAGPGSSDASVSASAAGDDATASSQPDAPEGAGSRALRPPGREGSAPAGAADTVRDDAPEVARAATSDGRPAAGARGVDDRPPAEPARPPTGGATASDRSASGSSIAGAPGAGPSRPATRDHASSVARPSTGTHRTLRSAPPTGSRSSAPPRSIIPPEHERWDVDGEARPENKIDPSTLRQVAPSPRRSERPSPIGGTLAGIRVSRERDEVVELACRGALTVCRSVVLLALKRGVLKGWDGAGAGLTRDAVRNVWIPTNSPSMFREVVARSEPYAGPHGTSAADGLFRAAVGSRGGECVLMPIGVGGKVVAVLAADDVRFGREGRERLEILARAVGEAFERIIVQSKRR